MTPPPPRGTAAFWDWDESADGYPHTVVRADVYQNYEHQYICSCTSKYHTTVVLVGTAEEVGRTFRNSGKSMEPDMLSSTSLII